jgi:hypothetical protein
MIPFIPVIFSLSKIAIKLICFTDRVETKLRGLQGRTFGKRGTVKPRAWKPKKRETISPG